MSVPPRPDPPPGAQIERTRLAWRRTVLLTTVLALLTLRQALAAEPTWARALGVAAVMLIWLAALLVGHRRIVSLSARKPDPGRIPALATAVTLGFAALGATLLSAVG